ncbi:MAG: hypothetical protein EBR23_03380 [Planctomycetia bacterium]|nr:hypothetical protein [Planctomycetia bacterium]
MSVPAHDPPALPPDAGGGNPYAAPTAPGRMDAAALGQGFVRHVRPVAILMIVQGALEVFMAILLVALTAAVPFMMPDLPADDGPAQEVGGASPAFLQKMMIVVYGVMAAGGLIAGTLHISAGICGLRFRRRMLGVVALTLGMASITTCYCAPTAIALAVYGLITYLNPAVVAAFGLGDAGVPAARIRARFGG